MNYTQYSTLLIFFFGFICFCSCSSDEEANGIGQVSFKVDNLVEVENATIPLAINVNIDNPYHGGGTLNIGVSGGAYGTDFETSAGSSDFMIDVAPNVLLSTFSISPINDELIEDDLLLTVTITAASGNLQLGEQTSFTLTIIDDEKPQEPVAIGFAEATNSVSEGEGTKIISIYFSEMLNTDAMVSVEIDAQTTATIGSDFAINGQTLGSVVIPLLAGSTEATFDLELIDDMDEEDLESIVFTLVNSSAVVQVEEAQTTISIIDNDGGVAPIDYLETFESNDGTDTYLNDVLGFENILINQTVDAESTIGLITSATNFADPTDPTLTSDNGLNIFYNTDQDPSLNGELDNLVISPQMVGAGLVTLNIDVAYAFKNQNNASVTFYWTEIYDGSGTFDEGDWNVMDTETAAEMDAEGFGNNMYKREEFNINPTQPFYIAVRVQQTVDDDFYRTRWRFDNWKVSN